MALSSEMEAAATHYPPPFFLPPRPRVPSTTCDLHPGETVTGFCASCLRERLAGLETSAPGSSSSARKSTSALKSVFLRVSGGGGGGGGPAPNDRSSSSSSFLRPSELRRCKSFSVARGTVGGGGGVPVGGFDAFGGSRAISTAFEPQRKSCDIRGRSTLWSLFNRDDQDRGRGPCIASSSSDPAMLAEPPTSGEIEAECRNLGLAASSAVPETREEEEEEEEEGEEGEEKQQQQEGEEDEDDGNEIKQAVDPVIFVGTSGEIEQCPSMTAKEEKHEPELKPMKIHIDLDSQHQQQAAKKPPPKDLKEIAGSFWLAASVFSKKLQKWRRKQKLKKQGSKDAAAAMTTAKAPKSSQRFRDTQSEMAVDAFGRRSCDTDPRFSLDAGRMSLDDPRFSWDEPRASWDGHLIGGGRSVFSRLPPILSVVEDSPAATTVQRSDGLILVEEDAITPGGSLQTRDYYLDSSSRRRRSLDRSSSIREQPAEHSEQKLASEVKVTPPAGGAEFSQFPHGSLLDRDWKEWSSNYLRDNYSGSFESVFRDPCNRVNAKKSRRWSRAWNIWGFLHRRNNVKGGADVVERSFSETWPELHRHAYSGKISRSNSSRSSFSGSMRRTSVEVNGHCKKRREDCVLDRNRSARYSPRNVDNGVLRSYLTPMRNSSSRRKGGSGNGRPISSHYFTRSMIGLY